MEIYEKLCALAGAAHVLRDEPLQKHTSFRIGGPARYLVEPGPESLPKLMAFCSEQNIPTLIIGKGSNLLCGDKGFPGVVIKIGRPMSALVVDGCQIKAGAGAPLSKVAAAAAENALSGFAFAAGIPGTMGGALVMNAGAYGGEMKDVLVSATVLTKEGEIKTLPAEELDLSYRHSVIPQKGYIVLEVTLQLAQGDREEIYNEMERLKQQRMEKQPLEYPSAGSTFKRPEGYFAGKLIEDAGLKGFSIGGAQVSEKHAGFVINKGNATAADVHTLMEAVQEAVRVIYGVELEPEVKFVGE